MFCKGINSQQTINLFKVLKHRGLLTQLDFILKSNNVCPKIYNLFLWFSFYLNLMVVLIMSLQYHLGRDHKRINSMYQNKRKILFPNKDNHLQVWCTLNRMMFRVKLVTPLQRTMLITFCFLSWLWKTQLHLSKRVGGFFHQHVRVMMVWQGKSRDKWDC